MSKLQAIHDLLMPDPSMAWQKIGIDYIGMSPTLALVFGPTKSMILTTMAAMAEREPLTNLMVNDFFKDTFFSGATLNRHLKDFEKLNLISFKPLSQSTIVNYLKSKNLNGKGIGHKTCEWCGISTFVRHAHHYPIYRKDGGKQTVNLCANCHREFHYLAGQAGRPELFYYELNHEEINKLIIAGRMKQESLRRPGANKRHDAKSAVDNPARSRENE